ncbi:MAG: FAD-binding oxidoreductase [Planctomycetes bacterium]|nr:FAD-binding oxidoreductase [Planctomycetota bacterium]
MSTTPELRSAAPRSHDELQELLRATTGRVRLVGGGSRQHRLPEAGDALRVRLDGIASIERLDGPDQTCSVDCGVPRHELDAALGPLGLELPCPGQGTLGGLFAADPIGAAAPGGAGPRSLLLGAEAVLADGTRFRSGARVVKSVAGFDVHKLVVGSVGRLFVITRLHLRLKPRPRAEQWFENGGLSLAEAIALVQRLRQLATGVLALQLEWHHESGATVRGRIGGRSAFVGELVRTHDLTASDRTWRDHATVDPRDEVLAMQVLPGQLPALLAAAPTARTLLWHGGNRCELALADAASSDATLAVLPRLSLGARIVGGPPARRGRSTPLDPTFDRLTRDLVRTFDPHGRFA